MLADWFLRFTFWGGGRRSDSDRGGGGGAGAILFVLALVLAIVAPLIGRMVQLAVSRRREALADVSAVELTRNPLGLARALRTISEDKEVLEVANRATQHLYIVNPIKSFEKRASGLWETPPADRGQSRRAEGPGRAVRPGRHMTRSGCDSRLVAARSGPVLSSEADTRRRAKAAADGPR